MSDTETEAVAPVRHRRIRQVTRPMRRPLTLAAVLIATFVAYTVLVVHWSPLIRLDDALNRNFHVQPLWPFLARIDTIGQASPLNWSPGRAFCLPLLGVVAVVLCWRRRSWRPLALAILTVVMENVAVIIPKFTLDRGRPLSGRSFFSNGDLYPSGHTANMVAYYGLCYYLITHYSKVSARTQRWLLRIVVALSLTMFATSLLLRWHWFSDLIGGFMLGGAVLALTIGIDAILPSGRRRAADPDASDQLLPAHRSTPVDDRTFGS